MQLHERLVVEHSAPQELIIALCNPQAQKGRANHVPRSKVKNKISTDNIEQTYVSCVISRHHTYTWVWWKKRISMCMNIWQKTLESLECIPTRKSPHHWSSTAHHKRVFCISSFELISAYKKVTKQSTEDAQHEMHYWCDEANWECPVPYAWGNWIRPFPITWHDRGHKKQHHFHNRSADLEHQQR